MKEYTGKEVRELLKIKTRATWVNRKEEILDYLHDFWDYDYEQRADNSYKFKVYEEYAPVEPLPRKLRDHARYEEAKAVYEEVAETTIQKDPWQTGSNLARIAASQDKVVNNHVTDTIAGYMRKIIREKYIFEGQESQWMYRDPQIPNKYEPLTEEMLDYLYSAFDSVNNELILFDTIGDLRSGYITIEEAQMNIC